MPANFSGTCTCRDVHVNVHVHVNVPVPEPIFPGSFRLRIRYAYGPRRPSRRPSPSSSIDGWLLYDFRGTNPIARSVIGFDERQIGTRRWFYLIPAQGEPVAILHAIEPHALRGAPGPHGPLPLLEGAGGAAARRTSRA